MLGVRIFVERTGFAVRNFGEILLRFFCHAERNEATVPTVEPALHRRFLIRADYDPAGIRKVLHGLAVAESCSKMSGFLFKMSEMSVSF